jgi:excisionase family DNA binding protein
MTRPAAITPKQVAAALNMSRRQVYRWIEKDEIQTTKIGGVHRIFQWQLANRIGEQEAADVFDAVAAETAEMQEETSS